MEPSLKGHEVAKAQGSMGDPVSGSRPRSVESVVQVARNDIRALESGVPVIVVPFMADQPANARIVTAAGAGLTVTSGADASASGPLRERLRKAIDTSAA